MFARCAPDVHTFCPVMTISSPSTTPCLDRGEVRAVVGFGVTLAVDVVTRDDPRQEVLTLLRRPVHDDRRPDERLAHPPSHRRNAGPAQLFGPNCHATPSQPRPPTSTGHCGQMSLASEVTTSHSW